MFNKKILTVVGSFWLVFLFHPAFASIFFADSFETGDYSYRDAVSGAGWTEANAGDGDSVTVSADLAHTGTYSLKFFFNGNVNLSDDGWAEMRYTTGEPVKEFYLRYYIYYPLNFTIRDADGPDNNKVGTTWGEDYTDRAKFNMEWLPYSGGPRVGFKVPRSNAWPHEYLVCEGSIDMGPNAPRFVMDDSYLGRWVSWEFHYKMDTGVGNGAWELFIDGEEKISVTGQSWDAPPCRPGYMRHGYLMGWANSGFYEDTFVYIDDVVFSTSYIGPIGSPLPVKPIPPADFLKED